MGLFLEHCIFTMGCNGAKEATCIIQKMDKRLEGSTPFMLLANMKCVLTIGSKPSRPTGGSERSTQSVASLFEPAGSQNTKYPILASFAVTDTKMILDIRRMKKGKDSIQQCLNVSFEDDLIADVGLEFSNDDNGAHLVFGLPDADRFLDQSVMRVPPQASVQISIDTWKAPDICTYVHARMIEVRKPHK